MKRILCIDGGGIKGVYPATILAEFEKQLEAAGMNPRLHKYFDLMSGTSTGGIIAVGLALGISLPALRIIRALDQIIEWRGKPKAIRCDNGPEYISHALAKWAEKHGIVLMFIQPGNPQQNAYVERYNRTVRYDWLNQNIFTSIEGAQASATKWLWTYNNDRPNMAIGGITPAQKLKRHMKNAA